MDKDSETAGMVSSTLVHVPREDDPEIEEIPRQEQLQGSKNIFSLALLPSELLTLIVKDAEMDPVSLICFGLTCSRLYAHVRKFYEWDLKAYRVGMGWYTQLDMQVTSTGAVRNYWWPDEWAPDDRWSDGITWYPHLVELIEGERIFKDMLFCWRCRKYKPLKAHDSTDFEDRSLERNEPFWDADQETLDTFWSYCSRCRAAEILIHEDGYKEYIQALDDCEPVELSEATCFAFKHESMGLKNCEERTPLTDCHTKKPAASVDFGDEGFWVFCGCDHKAGIDCKCEHRDVSRYRGDWIPYALWVRDPTWFKEFCKGDEKRYEAYCKNYTTWEEIFEDLGI